MSTRNPKPKTQNFRLTIAYDGTNYAGWQTQKNAPTVQETIEKVLERILQQKIRLTGASRTDSGAHAVGQTANFIIRGQAPNWEILLRGLNGLLPRDIRVLKIEPVPLKFHSQYHAKKKLYRYTIVTTPEVLPQERFFVYHYPYPLNVSAMKQAAKYLVGRHDFASFQRSKNVGADPRVRPDRGQPQGVAPTIRTIHRLQILQQKGRLIFDIEANGFLYTMVRTIVGTLLEVGNGKRTPENLKILLTQKNRSLAGPTVPAKGLCLVQIYFSPERGKISCHVIRRNH